MYKFLIKTPKSRSADTAIESILKNRDGHDLKITSAYIGGKDRLVNFGKLIEWLRLDYSRNLSIIFGVRGTYSEIPDQIKDSYFIEGKNYIFKPENKADSYLMNELREVFATFPLDEDVAGRIRIWGVENYHAKAILLSHRPEPRSAVQPIAGLMGSSNFTDSALHKPFGFEMDLFMETQIGVHDRMLEDFHRALGQMETDSMGYVRHSATREFEREAKYPAYESSWAAHESAMSRDDD